MTTPQLLSHLSDVADQYDAVFCDIWGVIHNGKWHFPEAYAALKAFKASGKPVVLISNSPRPWDGLQKQLADLGVHDDAFSAIVSSGDATRTFLTEYALQGSAWVIGPDRDLPLYEGLNVNRSGTPESAAFISCTGLFDDENDTLEQYHADLKAAAARGIPMICANPDRIVQRGDQIIYCAGTLADIYMTFGGEVIMAGKPYPPIYDLCYRALDSLTGKAVDKSRILAIGDGLPTDVLGANGQGLDLLFIAAGIHAAEATGEDGVLDPNLLTAVLVAQNAQAKYIAGALA
ncbi:TIGR01459 family HAD-type hydrolase [Asticcacaulis sp. BYS171W]|uniref:TIGR01459 family HAD-type hydrolase n=1 Tax=Asticcacaulis aquaticus TaxID=2984212 RepID=A0ABT5HZU4_9CAUL|nr:TIGR01459 family HAD-type hydrolase [Asticcacaulis aquaticus]MDC7684951.1 TIGR01459 family HAD-type hydrolase [Asticcacaulis aquaticus]